MTETEKTARTPHPLYTVESALAWYTFIADRLADDLRTGYPTADSGSAVGDYQEDLKTAQCAHQRFTDAWQRRDRYEAKDAWWELKNIAGQWSSHTDFPEPVSDGTMPCPIPSDDTGHPCTKKIPRGWTASEGHGGGHFWQSPKVAELEKAGVHYDAGQLLSGQPAKYHLPKDCTPDCWKWRDR
ncbi:hypothetical protein EV284_6443 [Streptomyces sp. BK022]|uniref:hypothetical protein n=1 Tax=Streptomyces sp. BK022 TaxID=2512123 RepID=UPI001028D1CE|nr:hypothetical protein [Streptomyces sp. BK022]RZU28277.1 hypothetical protein EV284_6443 [Streptomyces sp. BK022]